ncbi:membrane protein [Catellatospora sp. TT07R-123]|uniref:MMPL family transporter n=1 Tax=Catellatospora sp. TT07R-123 TaxID=2733863 RepID=UPI001B0A373F|nr:MMPL family transporter [Catellatospora sp. TT07R-123]GHJ48257.1 membrane protein [Catellatospora sp. TT07R-123]
MSESKARPGSLLRIGRFCARHAGLVVVAWIVAVVALMAADRAAGGEFADDYNLPGTSAQQGADLLAAHQPATGGFTSRIVFTAAAGSTVAAAGDALAATVSRLGALPNVRAVADPLRPGTVSPDGRTALAAVTFAGNPAGYGRPYLDQVDAAVAPARAAGLTVEYGGQLGTAARPKANDLRSELIGVAVALVVLLLGFGSVLAAGIPLLSALLGVAAGTGVLGLAAAAVTLGSVSPTLGVMMGLGVGIDYALLLATRYRRFVADGMAPVDAAAAAVARSGRAVVVAAVTVVVALLGLYGSGLQFVGRLGLAGGIAVAVAAVAALTLTPALLGLAGRRIDRWRVRPPVSEPTGTADSWQRYATLVGRRPWLFLLGGLLVLGVLALPALSLRLGQVDSRAYPTSYTDRRAFDAVTDAFGAGANAPLTVVVELPATATDRDLLAARLRTALAELPEVRAVGPFAPSPDGALLVAQLTPRTGPQDEATGELMDRLIDRTLPGMLAGSGAHGYVTGVTASQLQFRDLLAERLPLIVAAVVAAAFLLLLAVFRGLLVAAKAAVLNLLSIAASYGVLVAVFQWGWGSAALGLADAVPIQSYVPTMMFAIVFGLSMDYEIFLLSRIREAWLATGDNRHSVAAGLSATGRVITCAALIMTSVFAAFLLSTNVVVKMIALGLTASVIVDATVVRLILVPASMYVFGRANWWLPRWLDRVLPHLDPEAPEPAVPAAVAVPVHA